MKLTSVKNKTPIAILRERLIKGTSILLLREFIIKIIAVVGQVLLVRVLLPQYFGIFAILSFIVSTAEIFTDIGLTSAIIQKKDHPTSQQLSTVFFIKILLGFGAFSVLFFAGYLSKNIFHQLSDKNILMLWIFSMILLIKPLKSIPIALLERNLKYNIISFVDFAGIISYYVLAFPLALLDFGVWSFIIAVLGKELIELVIVFYKQRWIPSFRFNAQAVILMIRYGFFLQAGTIFKFIHRSTVPVIAGLNGSSYGVGLLDWSLSVASLPQAVSENFGRIAFSGFSKVQDNKKIISSSIEQSFKLLSLITLPFIIFILGFGSELIHYVATDKWLPALHALNWYIGATFFLNGTSALGHAIMAIGETKVIFIGSIVVITIEWILSYILFLYLGFSGIAIAAFIGSVFLFWGLLKIGEKKGISVNIGDMILPSVYILVSSLLCTYVVNKILGTSFPYLFIKILATTTFYILSCYLFSRSEFKQLIFLINNWRQSKKQ